MQNISVIGSGRWGTFLGWYAANYAKSPQVYLYDLKDSPNFIELQQTRKNPYLSLTDNIELTADLSKVLENDIIIISIGCQHLRGLAKELNQYNLDGKTFLLAIKGLEDPSAKTITQIMEEEIKQNIHTAILAGPGHVQDYMKKVPSCAVIDSKDPETKDRLIKLLSSDLIRFYYGNDLIGNEIGGALKNIIGLAAGALDGLGWYGLKGALMARAPIEVGRFIKHMGGNPHTAYGLSHLGDYEATLFSPHSQNRTFGEKFVKGETYGKLAEGYYTLKAVKTIADQQGIDMPITQALYKGIYEGGDVKQVIREVFDRSLKQEFEYIC